MKRVAANVVRRHQPVRSDLSLDTQVPLVHHWRLRIEGVSYNSTVARKRHIFVEHGGKRVSARIGCPWIGQLDARQADRVAKGHILSEAGQSQHHLPVHKHAIPGANGHAAIAFGIPGQRYPG